MSGISLYLIFSNDVFAAKATDIEGQLASEKSLIGISLPGYFLQTCFSSSSKNKLYSSFKYRVFVNPTNLARDMTSSIVIE